MSALSESVDKIELLTKEELSNHLNFLIENIENRNISSKNEQEFYPKLVLALGYHHENNPFICSLIKEQTTKQVFMAHMLLIKTSCFLSQEKNPIESQKTIDHVAPILDNLISSDCGSTIGFGIGFIIGQSLRLGLDCSNFFKLNNDKNIKKTQRLQLGVEEGLIQKSSNLAHNDTYITDLNERYGDCADVTKSAILKIFRTFYPNTASSEPIINPINEKITFFLSMTSDSSIISKIHQHHEQKAKELLELNPQINLAIENQQQKKLIESLVQQNKQLMNILEQRKQLQSIPLKSEENKNTTNVSSEPSVFKKYM
jgi:hypothetical protein